MTPHSVLINAIFKKYPGASDSMNESSDSHFCEETSVGNQLLSGGPIMVDKYSRSRQDCLRQSRRCLHLFHREHR